MSRQLGKARRNENPLPLGGGECQEDENHEHKIRDPLKKIKYLSVEEAEAGLEKAIIKLGNATSKDGVPLWTRYAAEEIIEAHRYLMMRARI